MKLPKPKLARHYKGLFSGSGSAFKVKLIHGWINHYQFFLASLCGLIEELTCILTFGMVTWELRAWYLFEVLEDD